MADTLRIDHVVILVDELSAAIEDFGRLGFTVLPGGRHPNWGSRNAIVPLADGSYLELIAFDNRQASSALRRTRQVSSAELRAAGRGPVEARVLAWSAPPRGLADFALLPPDTAQSIAAAREQGLAIEGPFPGSRTRPDGQEVRWQLGIPAAFDVPFLCGDVTDRSLRVPTGPATHHANGAAGIDRITIAVTDLDATIPRYRALLGTPPQDIASNWPDTRAAESRIGNVSLTLAMPTGQHSPLTAPLASRGEGIVSLDLRTADQARIPVAVPSGSQ